MGSSPRTAYILQIHKNPNQVNSFIYQLISEGQADVFVHIDKKNYQNIQGDIIESPYVKVLDNSINCEWGDISQVDATLLLLREVLASKNQYDFVCLRSGQDLLIKDGFKDFLQNNKNKIFMASRGESRTNLALMEISFPKITRRRYNSAHPARIYRRVLQSLYRKGINISPNTNHWPKEYTLYSGYQWFSIPYGAARYVLDFVDENKWYREFFENTLCPDEWFFHTLIMNSPYKEDVVDNNLVFIKWGDTLSTRNSPQNLTMDDKRLINESNQYFARKFDQNIDSKVIDFFANRYKFEGSKQVEPLDTFIG